MKSNKAVLLATGILLFLGLALATPSGLTIPLPFFLQTAYAQTELGIYYRGAGGEIGGANGKVGHHLYTAPKARCGATWFGKGTLSGSLPPGLRLNGSKIEGTPTQPGNWQVRVKFTGVKCKGRRYADEVVRVKFHIKGYAPRKLR